MDRRLTTIMVADVVSYSALMERAEEPTAVRLAGCQDLISRAVAAARGRIFNRSGDAFLAEFDSPINAVRSAVSIREELAAQAPDPGDRLQMRFGLHLADVIVAGDDLIGDGVNVAARIQQSAQPNAICVSQSLFDQIKRNSPFTFESLGEQRFKNLSEPMRIYRLRGHMGNHRLQSAPTRSSAAEPRPAAPNSVAVLPFICADKDEDQRYLAEGLTEETILELARFRKLHVASRSASFAFAGSGIDPASAARALGVSYVLEGQVRRMGDAVRLTLHLVSGETGQEVWADRLNREFKNLLDLIDDVTKQVAATILGRVEAHAIETARRKLPENMTAYDFMLRGLDHHRLGGITIDNSRQAVQWFDKAIDADPNYGPAYAWRICASSWLPEFNVVKESRFIDRALELDPNNPEAQRIMGVMQMFKGDFEAARHHHRRAIELSPCDAYLMARSAAFHTFDGQPGLALKFIEKARTLDPLLPVWCIEEEGIAKIALGEYAAALTALGDMPFQTFRSRLYQCVALMALGRDDDAKVVVAQALATETDLTVARFMRRESWRDRKMYDQIAVWLVKAGLPR